MGWLADAVAGVFKPAVDLVDELHTSEEEKGQIKAAILSGQASLEAQITMRQAADAGSASWLTRIWRPICALTFLSIVVADSYSLLPNPASDQFWLTLQILLGVYGGGRSLEKAASVIRK